MWIGWRRRIENWELEILGTGMWLKVRVIEDGYEKMNKRLKTLLIMEVITVIAISLLFGIIYINFTIPSDRELWRITDNNISNPIEVNNLLLFKGTNGNDYVSSYYYFIYAVDITTGKTLWSNEDFVEKFWTQSSSVYTDIIGTTNDGASIIVSSSYWPTAKEMDYILYALNSTNGEVLWKVDGYAGFFEYSIADTNRIFIAHKDGSLSAIDSLTGKKYGCKIMLK